MSHAQPLLPDSIAVALPGKGSNSRRNKFLGFLLACLMLSACGGDSSPFGSSGRASVPSSSSNGNIVSGKTRQLTARVSNPPHTAVTWSVRAGTVSSSGLFTAPTVGYRTRINVTATSQADSSKSASVASRVNPAPACLVPLRRIPYESQFPPFLTLPHISWTLTFSFPPWELVRKFYDFFMRLLVS
jgi:hypothetical protein